MRHLGVGMMIANFDGQRLEKTMGHLVELGIIVFGVEILAESSFAPPDTYEKKFQTVSNSFTKCFKNCFKQCFKQFFKKSLKVNLLER